MAIKVLFPSGANTATVSGLFQWDYGQTLEIECAEIGSEILEVHFACHNMNEAVVRVCSFSNGIGTVTIPDECLEQASALTAWVYRVDGTQGHTIKTITLPITARTRPNKNRDIAEKYIDEYGQLMEEVNEAVDALEKGNITAARALNADNAKHASTASSAQSATHATVADNASNAQIAQVANAATSVKTLLHATVNINNGEGTAPSLTDNAIYLVIHYEQGNYKSGVFVATGGIQSTHIGNLNMVIYNETLTLANLLSDATVGGTLKFYKMGGLS